MGKRLINKAIGDTEMKITKKAQREAEVVENRKAAFIKRAKGLLGHVFDRQSVSGIFAAFEAGVTADEYAASVAALEPVGLCLHPMKVDAVNAMEQNVRAATEKLLAKLAEHGGDIYGAFPYNQDWRGRSDTDRQDEALHGHVRSLTRATEDLIEIRRNHYYNFRRVADVDDIEDFIQKNRNIAAANYDAFICKMVSKVGPGVVSATIDGSHVWDHSILTATKIDGSVERWKTKTIWNVSKLGLSFNQWPTRLIK